MRMIDRDVVDAMILAQFAYMNLRSSVMDSNPQPYVEVYQFVEDPQVFASIAKAVGAEIVRGCDGIERFSYIGCVFVHRRSAGDRAEVA